MRFIFSGAKQKIQKYGVEDPALKYFIFNYENLIDWNQIRTKEEISRYILKKLIDQQIVDMIKKMDSKIYVDNIDTMNYFVRNQEYDHTRLAMSIYRTNKLAAKKFILEKINEEKKIVYLEWLKMMRLNFAESPAFMYILLRKVFDSSSGNSLDPPVGFDLKSVNDVKSLIYKKDQINVGKEYEKALFKNQSKVESEQDKEGDWIRIPSLRNDRENYELNLERLRNLSSPRGWCTAGSHSMTYLSKGDFWLLITGGEARVAVRLQGDEVAEIRGHKNSIPFEYSSEILSLFEKRNLDKESGAYLQIKNNYEETIGNNQKPEDVFNTALHKIKGLFENEEEGGYYSNKLNLDSIMRPISSFPIKVRKTDSFIEKAKRFLNECPLELMISINPNYLTDFLENLPQDILQEVDENILEYFMKKNRSMFLEGGYYGNVSNVFERVLEVDDNLIKFAEYVAGYVGIDPTVTLGLRLSDLKQIEVEEAIGQKFNRMIYFARQKKSYQLLNELKSVKYRRRNPREIIDEYYDEVDFFGSLYERDKEDILNVIHDYYDEEDSFDSLYETKFIQKLDSDFMIKAWSNFTLGDPVNRLDELESEMQNSNWEKDDFDEVYESIGEHYQSIVEQDPWDIKIVPDYFLHEWDWDWDWYVERCGEAVISNHSLFQTAAYLVEEYCGKNQLEYLVECIGEDILKIVEDDPKLLTENEWLYEAITESYTDEDLKGVFEENPGILSELLPKVSLYFIQDNVDFIKNIVEFKFKNKYEAYLFADRVENNFGTEKEPIYSEKEMRKLRKKAKPDLLKVIFRTPSRFSKLTSKEEKKDKDFIEAWHSTDEIWMKIVANIGKKAAEDLAPPGRLETDSFLLAMEKDQIIRNFGEFGWHNLPDGAYLEVDKFIEKNPGEDNEEITMVAANRYAKQIKSFTRVGKVDRAIKLLSRIPNFIKTNKSYLDNVAYEIARSIEMTRSDKIKEYGYSELIKSMDKELYSELVRQSKNILNVRIDKYGMEEEEEEECVFNFHYLMPNSFSEEYNMIKNTYIENLGKIISGMRETVKKKLESGDSLDIRYFDLSIDIPDYLDNDADIAKLLLEVKNIKNYYLEESRWHSRPASWVRPETEVNKHPLDLNRLVRTKKGVGKLVDFDDRRYLGESLILFVEMPDGTEDRYVYEGEGISDVSLKEVREEEGEGEDIVTSLNWYSNFKISKYS